MCLAFARRSHTRRRPWRTSSWRSSTACECVCMFGDVSHTVHSASQPGVTGVVCADSHGLLLHSMGRLIRMGICINCVIDDRQGQWRREERRGVHGGHPARERSCHRFSAHAHRHDRVRLFVSECNNCVRGTRRACVPVMNSTEARDRLLLCIFYRVAVPFAVVVVVGQEPCTVSQSHTSLLLFDRVKQDLSFHILSGKRY